MILDSLKNRGRYEALHPDFATAFDFLDRLDPKTLKAGRIGIDGDRMFALVVDAEGKGRDGTRLESHRRYIDIQYQASGADRIGWAPAGRFPGGGYDAEADLEFHDAAPEAWAAVGPGRFAVFFSREAHAPMGGAGRLLKVVVKVSAREFQEGS